MRLKIRMDIYTQSNLQRRAMDPDLEVVHCGIRVDWRILSMVKSV